ncbi:GmrSD restriction endonuclease domain-containing protein [Geodermatophilus sp. SYSU D00698]
MHLRPARPRPAPLRAALALGLVAALGSGCTALLGDPPAVPAAGSALEALDSVEVRGRAPQTGYSRDEFGDGWVDTDQNGCDTRNDVLARDLTGERFEPGTRDCVVVSGTLVDPYSGRTIAFRRGEGTSEAVQIDHVVALSDAWQKGAQQWDADRRTEFANDPLNLLAVDGPLNQAKGDSDAATWLPPARSYRCAYVARQVAVKVTYGLWMTRAERDAVAGVLDACPDEPLPGRGPLPGQEAPGSAPSAPATPYPDCAAVRAAGAAPLREGDPGWNPSLDGDGDGVGCEG